MNPKLLSKLQLSQVFWLNYAWYLAISGGLFVWAIVGGLTVFRHSVLRFLLARSQTFPWRTQAFLDHAARCILLRRVGGGYSFIHRRLLDYFASLDQPVSQPELPHTQTTPPRVCSACGSQENRSAAQFCPRCGNALKS